MTTLKNRALFRQFLVGLYVGLLAMVNSIAYAYTSPALPSMKSDPKLRLTENEASWISSAFPASAFIGSVLAGFLIDILGRRNLNIAFIPPFILSWIWIALSPNALHIIGARLLCGVCVGVLMIAISVQMSECVQADLRSYMNMLPGILCTIGVLATNAAGKYLDWRGVSLMGAILLLPPFFLIIYLPESPIFFFNFGKKSEAFHAMTWLRDSSTIAEKELQEYSEASKNSVTKKSVAKFTDLFSGSNLWPILVALILNIFQQLSGLGIIFSFSTLIFEATNTPNAPFDPASSSVIVTTANVFVGLFCNYLVAVCKRRVLMRTSSILSIVSLLILSLYAYEIEVETAVTNLTTNLPFIPLICVTVYITGLTIGWTPMASIFLGEGLPSKVIGIGSSFAMSANWIFFFMASMAYFPLVNSLGYSFLFLFLATNCACGMILLEFLMPETLGKSLAEMDRFYMMNYVERLQKKAKTSNVGDNKHTAWETNTMNTTYQRQELKASTQNNSPSVAIEGEKRELSHIHYRHLQSSSNSQGRSEISSSNLESSPRYYLRPRT